MTQLVRLAGVKFEGRQEVINRLSIDDHIYMERDYFNQHDRNAIGVFNEYDESIGWIPRETAAKLSPLIDGGQEFEVRLNRILGGGFGLLFGVEIAITKVDRKQQERVHQEIIDLLNNQTEEQSKQAMEQFNKSMRETHERHILEGNVEDLLVIINNHWLSLESIQSFIEYSFQMGRFEDCFKALQTLENLATFYHNQEILNYCKENIEVYLSYGYDQPLPIPNQKNYPQSMERFDETYPDLDRIREASTHDRIDEFLKEITAEMESSHAEIRAEASFLLGELYFLSGKVQEALELYMLAIRDNPNKALYWGYTAQVMNRNQVDALICSRVIRHAIDLDPANPRWHFLQAILLLRISQAEEIDQLIETFIYEITTARDLCREDQTGLKEAIMSLIIE
ncbi:HIRAN domain-containing protein [Mesobacillus sp. LC4]